MKCEYCGEDHGYFEMHPVKLRPEHFVNDKVLVCWNCLETIELNTIIERINMRRFS